MRVRTVDALRVGDGARGAQGIVVLLVAHQRVHSQDGCKHGEMITINTKLGGNSIEHIIAVIFERDRMSRIVFVSCLSEYTVLISELFLYPRADVSSTDSCTLLPGKENTSDLDVILIFQCISA